MAAAALGGLCGPEGLGGAAGGRRGEAGLGRAAPPARRRATPPLSGPCRLRQRQQTEPRQRAGAAPPLPAETPPPRRPAHSSGHAPLQPWARPLTALATPPHSPAHAPAPAPAPARAVTEMLYWKSTKWFSIRGTERRCPAVRAQPRHSPGPRAGAAPPARPSRRARLSAARWLPTAAPDPRIRGR